MIRRMYAKRLTVAVTMIIVTVFCGQALSAEFSADMLEIGDSDTTVSKIFVKGLKYRMELMENGQQIFIIVNQETNVTQAINISEKAYMEMPCDDFGSLANDPFQSLKYTAAIPDASVKPLGKETVAGVECDKSVVSYGGNDLITQWVSSQHDFPLKIVAHATVDMVIELANIKETAIDDGLFVVPEGYTIMGDDPPAAPAEPVKQDSGFPEWMKDAASAELVQLPLEKVMLAGEMIRVEVMAGKDIFVNGINNHGGNSTFNAIPCLNGKPIEDPSVVFSEYGGTRTYNLMMEGQARPTTLTETPDQADMVLIRVDQGQVMMKIEYNKKP
ncbi:MAG: DUF4412 domain-containing protein [FCB group bacterium]|nr:DUF4412 domain-containing protein [FCB group bacterium]